MEGNDNNTEKPKLKANTFKMQDLFALSEKKEINIKSNEDQNNNSNQNDLDLQKQTSSRKNFLYKSIYESTISFYNNDDDNEIKKDDKDEKVDKENKDDKGITKEKPKVTLQRKNNLLNYRRTTTLNDLSYIEPVGIFIDDINRRPSEIIIQNYECKFMFDEKVHYEFIYLVHFSPKYFEFPVYYVSKGSYDESTKITTITLKDYRSFKIYSSSNNIYNKLFNQPKEKKEFYKYLILETI